MRPNGALATNILEHARDLERELVNAHKLRNAVLRLCAFVHQNCGETDDWPMEIAFDNEITAGEFMRLMNKIEQLANAPKRTQG